MEMQILMMDYRVIVNNKDYTCKIFLLWSFYDENNIL